MTISEAYPYLKSIGLAYGLKLNRAKDFKFARIILANLYNRELVLHTKNFIFGWKVTYMVNLKINILTSRQ